MTMAATYSLDLQSLVKVIKETPETVDETSPSVV